MLPLEKAIATSINSKGSSDGLVLSVVLMPKLCDVLNADSLHALNTSLGFCRGIAVSYEAPVKSSFPQGDLVAEMVA